MVQAINRCQRGNPGATSRASRGFVVLAVGVLACAPACGAGFDVVAGASATSSQRFTGAAFASLFEEAPAGDRRIGPIATLGWIDARHTQHDDLGHQVFLAAGGARLVTLDHRWFFSEQLAATSARTDALSSRFEFMTGAGWQSRRFIVMLRHVSNAHVLGGGKNLGETMLLTGVRW